jgi:hypothetical protein
MNTTKSIISLAIVAIIAAAASSQEIKDTRIGKLTFEKGTRQMVVTEHGPPDISSRKTDIAKNPDGSIDIYFGPKAPAGKETNRVQTVPEKGWFAYFRFYGPTEPFFDKSWTLPDTEQVN